MSLISKTCCFIGHRKIEITEELINKLKNAIEYLIIEKNVQIFLFGSRSNFNDLCLKIVAQLKEKHKNIKLIYIIGSFVGEFTHQQNDDQFKLVMPQIVEFALANFNL